MIAPNAYIIPLGAAQPQRITVTLGGTRYTLRLRWNIILGTWVMDISDDRAKPLANGIALVAGADLVNQLNYLGFPGALITQSGSDAALPPSYAGLGLTDFIIYVPYGQTGQSRYVRKET